VWIAAMGEEEMAHSSNALSFNHLVYSECRMHARAFLAAQGPAFAEAAAAYGEVADALRAICDIWPYPASTTLPLAKRGECVRLLREARDAEARAIAALDAVVKPERGQPVPMNRGLARA